MLILLTATLAAGCAAPTRPPPAPANSPLVVPWGAWSPREMEEYSVELLEQRLTPEVVETTTKRLERDAEGRMIFPTLALSVGGARGAYGAGVLVGWTESGTRPTFEIVTAGSAGALMATAAYLGPEYDWMLREFFSETDPEPLLRRKSKLNLLFGTSTVDRSKMVELFESYIDEALVDAVARAYREGRDLYVGTVDLDDDEFVVWDMGAIAASGRPDRVEHFRRVIVASSAIPGVFEPVYFEVEIGGERYWQMHVDAGVKEGIFVRPFMMGLDRPLEFVGMSRDQLAPRLYVIMNDSFAREAEAVEPRGIDIVGAAMSSVYTANRHGAIERTYVLARDNDVEFRITAIPDDFAAIVGSSDFDVESMRQLFELGRERGRTDTHWRDRPPASRGLRVDRRRFRF